MELEIRKKLIELKSVDDEDYANYLFDLAKNRTSVALKFIDFYEEALLQNSDWYLKKVAFYALLFKFKKSRARYIEEAQKSISNKDEEFDVRIWALNGLTTVFNSETVPLGLLKELIVLMDDESENILIRNNCLDGILTFSGISDNDIFLKSFQEDLVNNDELSFINKKKIFSADLNLMRNKIDYSDPRTGKKA